MKTITNIALLGLSLLFLGGSIDDAIKKYNENKSANIAVHKRYGLRASATYFGIDKNQDGKIDRVRRITKVLTSRVYLPGQVIQTLDIGEKGFDNLYNEMINANKATK